MGALLPAKLLELQGVSAGYVAGRPVIHDVNFAIREGSCTLVVGHNGAGKTTLLWTVFGLLRVARGDLIYRGTSIVSRTASERVRQGMGHVVGGRGVFPGLTVRENLQVAQDIAGRRRRLRKEARDGRLGGQAPQMIERGLEMFPEVGERLRSKAGELSGGQQRMLALCMALAQGPELLLLDEPSLGLSPIMVERFYDGVQGIRQPEGTSILVVEQTIDPRIIRPDRVIALQMGRVLFEGSGDEAGDGSALWAYV